MFNWFYRKYLLFKLRMNRTERLVHLKMDIDYFYRTIQNTGSEEELRDELKEEREKDAKEQDPELINRLQEKIDLIDKAQKEIDEYKVIERGLTDYLRYINTNADEKIKEVLKSL